MKKFHISDVLSVTTEKLVSKNGMSGVLELLGYIMDNEELRSHQIPQAYKICKPFLLELYPTLAEIEDEIITENNLDTWLELQIKKFGAELMITPIPKKNSPFN